MSFRKRNTVISNATASPSGAAVAKHEDISTQLPGVRPSPLDARPTTSTGTASLDGLLGGHAGLPLGTSLLIEEHGTTDFAGILLRYYAAEGLVQGHQVHALGLGEYWRAELPGVSDGTKSSRATEAGSEDKMKIAWRYEALASVASRERDPGLQRQASAASGTSDLFCHSFDLTKKLNAKNVKGQIGYHSTMTVPSLSPKEPTSPFRLFLKNLSVKLANSPANWVHRVMVPNLLSPTVYSTSLCRPEEVLQFLHALRALLRQYPTKLTAIITLPLSLYPRNSGLTRWLELLCDGVLELVPLQLKVGPTPPPTGNSDAKPDEQPQGLLKVHSLPIYHEKGGGGSNNYVREDMSFSLSRTKGLILKPFSLPPVGDDDSDKKSPEVANKSGIEF